MESNSFLHLQILFSKSVLRRTLQSGFVAQDELKRPPYSAKRYRYLFSFISFWFFPLLALSKPLQSWKKLLVLFHKTHVNQFFMSDKFDPFVLETNHQKHTGQLKFIRKYRFFIFHSRVITCSVNILSLKKLFCEAKIYDTHF